MIKVSEKFFSAQGEGHWIGQPSVFLRTFGCNFRCKSFGLPKGQQTTEVNEIIKNIDSYEKFDDLPLVRTGCDSYPAIYTEFKHLSPLMSEEDLAKDIRALIPDGRFHPAPGKEIHLVITGGEPLLGWQRSYPALLDLFPDLTNVTFETNGTQPLSKSLVDYFNQRNKAHDAWASDEHHIEDDGNGGYQQVYDSPEPPKPITVTFSVSPKLSASGELWSQAIRPEVIRSFEQVLDRIIYLKFVVAGEEHIPEVEQAIQELGIDNVFLMPVGGCYEEYIHYQEIVYDLCLKYGYRMSPRYHVNVKGNQWGV